MNDLMREMDSMQIPPNSFELDEPRSKNGRDICAYWYVYMVLFFNRLFKNN